MYERYYGLRERPFDLSPNPRFLCFTPQHREALVHLEYGLAGQSGLTVLLGEAGTGKTTLIRAALLSSNSASTIVHLSNPTLTRSEFFEYLSAGFGFSQEAAGSKIQFLRDLENALKIDGGPRLALIVDEAQSVPYELLEEIRLLTNSQANGRSLAVALVGQPELAYRLEETRLRQLKQRIVLRCELTPLNLKDTAGYISSRIHTAGGEATKIFTREAVVAIHQHSAGIPRVISVICDNALVSGFAESQKPVGVNMIVEVCRSLSLSSTPSPAVPPPVADPPRETQATMFSQIGGRRRFSFF
jgi:general secretion pathway protein A